MVERPNDLTYDRSLRSSGPGDQDRMRRPLAAEVLSDLIGAIYDCAIDPERWPDVLERLRLELEFANASLSMLAMPSGAMLLNVLKGTDPYWAERAGQYGPEVVEQWGGAAKMQSFPLGEALVLSLVRLRSEWMHNRFYLERVKPQGILDTLAIALTRDSNLVSSIGFGRHDCAGEITELEISAAQLLSPHLRRAVTINRLLDLKHVEAASFA